MRRHREAREDIQRDAHSEESKKGTGLYVGGGRIWPTRPSDGPWKVTGSQFLALNVVGSKAPHKVSMCPHHKRVPRSSGHIRNGTWFQKPPYRPHSRPTGSPPQRLPDLSHSRSAIRNFPTVMPQLHYDLLVF